MKRCVEQLPHVNLEAVVQPITRSVLRVSATVLPEFTWRTKFMGKPTVVDLGGGSRE